jgi:2-oxoglutarate/2-oxoacid ferredoxin oxidoreductase subunit alpha
MVEKRLRKLNGLKEQVLPPYTQGPMPADILLVTWGSSRGACMESADELNNRGIKTALIHFYQVWPLIPEQFLPDFEKAKRVVMVESNATGQLARVIRSLSGYEIKEKILRYDGLPITPAYILHELGKGE